MPNESDLKQKISELKAKLETLGHMPKTIDADELQAYLDKVSDISYPLANLIIAMKRDRNMELYPEAIRLFKSSVDRYYGHFWGDERAKNLEEQLKIALDKIVDENKKSITEKINQIKTSSTSEQQKKSMLKSMIEDYKYEKEEILQILAFDGSLLEFVSPDFKKDKDLVTTAVQNNALAIQYASKGLQNDPTIAIMAVKQNLLFWDLLLE